MNPQRAMPPSAETARPRAVVMGASAGALDVLMKLLPGLPSEFALPVVVVVHIPPDRESILSQLLKNYCRLVVKEAEDKELLANGTVYVAPPDYHVLIEPDFRLSLSNDEPVLYSRPSIDVLFESAADAYGEGLVGVVLTGANHDGARGLRSICDRGGVALVQDPETADASAMPRAAISVCPEARVLPPSLLSAELVKIAQLT